MPEEYESWASTFHFNVSKYLPFLQRGVEQGHVAKSPHRASRSIKTVLSQSMAQNALVVFDNDRL